MGTKGLSVQEGRPSSVAGWGRNSRDSSLSVLRAALDVARFGAFPFALNRIGAPLFFRELGAGGFRIFHRIVRQAVLALFASLSLPLCLQHLLLLPFTLSLAFQKTLISRQL
jgi:hypothetical protein